MKYYNTGVFYHPSGIYAFCVENGIVIHSVNVRQNETALYASLTEEEAVAFYLKFGDKPQRIDHGI